MQHPANLVVSTRTFDQYGNVISETDGQGATTTRVFGASGALISCLLQVIYPPVLINGIPTGATENYFYDSRRNLTHSMDALGNTTLYKVNTFGWQISRQDPNGNITTMSYTAYVAGTSNAGNLSQVDFPAGPHGMAGVSRSFGYDLYDNMTYSNSAAGYSTLYEWDKIKRLTKETDPLSNVTTWAYTGLQLSQITAPPNQGSLGNPRSTFLYYDSANRNISIKTHLITGDSVQLRVQYTFTGYGTLHQLTRQPQGPSGPNSNYTYGYDVLDRQTSSQDPNMHTSTTTYAPFCNQYIMTTAQGIQRIYTMDSVCRLTQIASLSEERLFGYDSRRREISAGNSGRFDWNLAPGQLVGSKYANSVTTNAQSFEYDLAGRKTKIVFPKSELMSSFFDKAGNLLQFTDVFGRSTKYSYLNDYRLYQTTYISGSGSPQIFTYSYASGNLQQIQYPPSTNIALNFTWDHDRLISMQYLLGSTNLQRYQYQYDNSNNVTQLTDTPASPGLPINYTYGYDLIDRINSASDGTNTDLFQYDGNDNRTSFTRAGNVMVSAYDLADQILSRNYNGSLYESYTHDLDGNLVSRTVASTGLSTLYGWTDFSNLAQFSRTGSATEQNSYDAHGIRRLRNDGSHYYDLDGLSINDSSLSVATSYLMADQIRGLEKSGNVYFFILDAVGSVRATVDISGVIQTTSTLDEFGILRASTGGTTLNSLTFVGGLRGKS